MESEINKMGEEIRSKKIEIIRVTNWISETTSITDAASKILENVSDGVEKILIVEQLICNQMKHLYCKPVHFIQ